MDKKDLYRKLCEDEKSIPIFSQAWWMDAVCGEDNWNVIIVKRGENVVATLPYYIKKRHGLKYITQPEFTQTNGIWIKYPPELKYSSRLAFEWNVMQAVITGLEALSVHHYRQHFHYSITNWQPFYWRGFNQTTRYTYVIDQVQNLEMVFSNFHQKRKREIRKAEEQAKVFCDSDISRFYELNRMVYSRQNISCPYSFEQLEHLDNACRERDRRRMLFAEDKSGNVVSGVYVIWDSQSAYLLLSGSDPTYRSSNFMSLLVWEAIQFSSTVTTKFDFEGSMIPGCAEYNRRFGAVPKPYFNISKSYSIPISVMLSLRDFSQKSSNRGVRR